MTIPPRPPRIRQLLQTISILAGDQLAVPIGASHISSWLQEIQSKEWEEREQMNNMLGFIQAQEEELCNIAFPMCICRLTLAWISSPNSTTHEECWFILTALPSLTLGPYIMPTAYFCCPVSTGHSRHPSPIASSEFLCPTPLTGDPFLLPVTSRSRV